MSRSARFVFILQNNLILYRRYFYLIDQTQSNIKLCMVCRYKMIKQWVKELTDIGI